MTLWIQDYWYLCVAALVIGLATAAWIWLGGRRRATGDTRDDIDAPARRVADKPGPAAPLEPAKPVIDVAQPAIFAPPPPAGVPAAPANGDRPNIPAATGEPDDLKLIKGVGPKLNALLTTLGVTRFDQIAAWTADDIAEVDRFLGSFSGRIARDNWVEQAGYLARGDQAGFAAKFGAI